MTAIGCPEPVRVVERMPVLGDTLTAEVHMTGPAEALACLADIREQIATVGGAMDSADPDSELSRINAAAADGYVEVENEDLYRVIRLALDYARFSRGAYDPTLGPVARLWSRESHRVPTETELAVVLERVGWDRVVVAPEARALRFSRPGMQFDLDRVIRGFALDAASRSFARLGSQAGLLRLGDAVLAWNAPPGSARWSIPLDDPRDTARPLLVLRAANRALAVAAHAENGPPRIFDRGTGRPATSDVRVAVALADSVADASALAAALFVGGAASGSELLDRMIRAEAVLLVASHGEPVLFASASLRDHVDLSPELSAEVGGRIRFILPPVTLDRAPRHD